jgi:hypothetical protein
VKRLIKTLDDALLSGAGAKEFRARVVRAMLKRLQTESGYGFIIHYRKDAGQLLSALCEKYGSDKGGTGGATGQFPWPIHTYADYLARLFDHCRRHVRRVFECGLGTTNPDIASSMGGQGRPGASLRVWRDYFEHADIYGADIDRSILFTEDRIRTCYLDQTSQESIASMWREIGVADFDLMIDDGLHTYAAGVSLFEGSIAKLAPDGLYVIEDMFPGDVLQFLEYFKDQPYKVDYVNLFRPDAQLGNNSLIVIRR